jgi:hypothetical protein
MARSRGLGDVYKRQIIVRVFMIKALMVVQMNITIG